jgi:hypothetical protein
LEGIVATNCDRNYCVYYTQHYVINVLFYKDFCQKGVLLVNLESFFFCCSFTTTDCTIVWAGGEVVIFFNSSILERGAVKRLALRRV